jgi:hypothetical protein
MLSGVVMVGGAAWFAPDYNSGELAVAPAGFTSFDSLIGYFGTINRPPAYVGGVAVYNPGGMVLTFGPQFGIIFDPNQPLNFGQSFGFLYVPVALSGKGRTYLMQYITGLSLGPNVNPLLTTAQITQYGLQYVVISLDTEQKPLSSGSAHIDFEPWMRVNLLPLFWQ